MSLASAIEADCTRILRAWPLPDQDPAQVRRQGESGSPLRGGWWTRQALTQTLAYWVQAALAEEVITASSEQPILLAEVVSTANALRDGAEALAGWQWGPTLARELHAHAGDLDALTTERAGGICWTCACGQRVCIDEGQAGDMRAIVECPGCRLRLALAQWVTQDGTAPAWMLTDDLVRWLRDHGVHTSPLGLRQRAARGTIPQPVLDSHNRRWYNARACMKALVTGHAESA